MLNKGYIPNLAIYTALIDAFFKVNNKEQALVLLKQVEDKGYRLDKVTCSTVINGLWKKLKNF